jgi:hypothetical protein
MKFLLTDGMDICDDGGLEFELAACNQALLSKVGRPGVLVKVDHPCAQMGASGGVE